MIQIMQGEERQASQLKQKWFDFTKQLVSNQISLNLYKLFIIIQSLQFLAYHNNGLIQYNAFGFSFLARFLQYINLYPLMMSEDINIFVVPMFTILIFIHLTLIILGFQAYHKKMEKKNKSIEDRNFHKNRLEYFINLLMICFNTVLTIPICQTSVTSIYCLNSAPFTAQLNCYSTSQIFIAFLSFINLAWLLVSSLFFALYYYSRNPFSTNFLTCSTNWWNLGKFGVKIIPVLYFAYDPNLAYPVLFLVMINGCFISYIGLFRILLPYYRYNFDLDKFVHFIEDMVMLINICFIAIYAIDKGLAASRNNTIILVFWIFGSIFIARIRLAYFSYKKQQLIAQVNSLEKTKLQEVLEYIIYLIYEVQKDLSTKKVGFFLTNIGKTHQKLCQSMECYCQNYFQMIQEKGYYTNKQAFYILVLAIIDRIIAQNKKAYSFVILKSYILNYKIRSQIKAATTIAMIMQDKLDFSDQTLVKGLLFQLNQQYLDTRDMEVYRKFNQFLLMQEEESLKLVNLYLQYWQELIDQNSSIPKLHRLLIDIKSSKQELEGIVSSSLGIFHNHVRVLLLYKNFLKQVLNDYMGYLKYEQKHKIGLKQHKLSNVDAVNTIQFRPNQNLLVINFTRHFSAHSQILGNFKIVSISSNVNQFLGFSNSQLKGQSLNKLLPRIYHSVHDTFIERILDKKDCEIENRQIRIFPVNSTGHIIQCNIISKFMPSLATGINIVSFMQQCDHNKDEFFIIYDKSNGMVDTMNEEAEKALKDASHRKSNDALAIVDHINDLVPNWDYKKEVWRESGTKGRSLRSMNSLGQNKEELKDIQIIRSDGVENKFIKVLKFKGDFFTRMFSLDNLQSYKESNTIQQYLQYRKQKTFSNMNSSQLQDMICVQTCKLIERDRQKKKTLQKLQKNEKVKEVVIQSNPPKQTKICFIIIQYILVVSAIALVIYEIAITNINTNAYFQDTQLLNNINLVQYYLSDTTYILSLTATLMAYNSNMTLPYPNFVSSIELQPQLQKMNAKYIKLNNLIKDMNTIFISKLDNNEISQQILNVAVRYLSKSNSKQYYQQKTDIIQAVLQFILYGQQMSYKIDKMQAPIQQLLQQPGYYYIFANNLQILPNKLLFVKTQIINKIKDKLNLGYNQLFIVKIFIIILVVLSSLSVLIYYKYIYKYYILKVLNLYQMIKIPQIKPYQLRCFKYKASLKDAEIILNKPTVAEPNTQNKKSDSVINSKREVVMSISEEQHRLIEKQQSSDEYEHFLSFQEVPTLLKEVLAFIIWIIVYCVFLLSLLYVYGQGVATLQTRIQTLNKYSILEQSVIEMRLFSQLSLNMLNYWDKQQTGIIYAQLQKYLNKAVKYMDDKTLNTTDIQAEFAKKYLELRYLQSLVLKNDLATISTIANQIEGELENMDNLVAFLSGQSTSYLLTVEADSQSITHIMNISISSELVLVLIFWVLVVRRFYYNLLKEHESTYQMYNILSFNLRKEIQSN